MSYYLFKPWTVEGKRGSNFTTHVTRKWVLPGVRCPVCLSTWGTTGVYYPTIDLSSLPLAAKCRPWPLPLDEFNVLRDQLAQHVGSETILLPGTGFGPLIGKASGKLNEILWPTPWICLIRDDILDHLLAEGLDLPHGTPSELTHFGKKLSRYIELETVPQAYLGPGMGTREMPPCSACGRVGYSAPPFESLRLDPDTIPKDTDLFRLRDLHTYIIASQRFKDVCDSLKISVAEFRPIPFGK